MADVTLTQIETDDLIIHNSHAILGKMFTSVEGLIQSSTVFNARDKNTAAKCLRDRKEHIVLPMMLAAAVLNPADLGSSLTQAELMDGMEFIHDTAKSFGRNECDDAINKLPQQTRPVEKGFCLDRQFKYETHRLVENILRVNGFRNYC